MVFDIIACVALVLSSLCTLFIASLVYVSNRKFKAERDRINNLKNSLFGGDSFDLN